MNRELMQRALDALTLAVSGPCDYPHTLGRVVAELRAALAAPVAPPRHVGESKFEGWLSCHEPDRTDGRRPSYTKQDMRDAYAAGMGDPMAEPVAPDGGRSSLEHVCGMQGFGALGDVCPACRAWSASRAAPVESADRKAARVHELVNAGDFAGMSEAFDQHVGAAAWTDPAWRDDASTWAAAWRAALAAPVAPAGDKPATSEPVAVINLNKDAITDAIAAGLRGAFHCHRVWSAWGVGTMSEDDFSPVDESDTPADLADAVLALFATAPPDVQRDAELLDWLRDNLFTHKWNGVVGPGCAVQWQVAPDYRSKQRGLTDESGTMAGDFRRAITAAMAAKVPT